MLKKTMNQYDLLDYEIEVENRLAEIPLKFYARSVPTMHTQCTIDSNDPEEVPRLIGKGELYTEIIKLRKERIEMQGEMDTYKNIRVVLIAHIIVFLVVLTIQCISISCKSEHLFFFTVVLNSPTSILAIICIQDHFTKLVTDLNAITRVN